VSAAPRGFVDFTTNITPDDPNAYLDVNSFSASLGREYRNAVATYMEVVGAQVLVTSVTDGIGNVVRYGATDDINLDPGAVFNRRLLASTAAVEEGARAAPRLRVPAGVRRRLQAPNSLAIGTRLFAAIAALPGVSFNASDMAALADKLAAAPLADLLGPFIANASALLNISAAGLHVDRTSMVVYAPFTTTPTTSPSASVGAVSQSAAVSSQAAAAIAGSVAVVLTLSVLVTIVLCRRKSLCARCFAPLEYVPTREEREAERKQEEARAADIARKRQLAAMIPAVRLGESTIVPVAGGSGEDSAAGVGAFGAAAAVAPPSAAVGDIYADFSIDTAHRTDRQAWAPAGGEAPERAVLPTAEELAGMEPVDRARAVLEVLRNLRSLPDESRYAPSAARSADFPVAAPRRVPGTPEESTRPPAPDAGDQRAVTPVPASARPAAEAELMVPDTAAAPTRAPAGAIPLSHFLSSMAGGAGGGGEGGAAGGGASSAGPSQAGARPLLDVLHELGVRVGGAQPLSAAALPTVSAAGGVSLDSPPPRPLVSAAGGLPPPHPAGALRGALTVARTASAGSMRLRAAAAASLGGAGALAGSTDEAKDERMQRAVAALRGPVAPRGTESDSPPHGGGTDATPLGPSESADARLRQLGELVMRARQPPGYRVPVPALPLDAGASAGYEPSGTTGASGPTGRRGRMPATPLIMEGRPPTHGAHVPSWGGMHSPTGMYGGAAGGGAYAFGPMPTAAWVPAPGGGGYAAYGGGGMYGAGGAAAAASHHYSPPPSAQGPPPTR